MIETQRPTPIPDIADSAAGASVVATDLVKRYDDTVALRIKRIAVFPGEVLALVGNNGAGKTTLLRCVLDLIRPTQGEISVDGIVVGERDDWKERVGAFLDTGFLIDYLRPSEYFRLVGGAYGLSAESSDRRAAEYVSFLGPTVLEDGLIRDLSLGNAVKVGIVGALLPEPALLVLDEPFANLDPRARLQLETMLRREAKRGATLLISSHDLDHVVDVSTRVLVLADGRVERDTPSMPDTLAELRAYFARDGAER